MYGLLLNLAAIEQRAALTTPVTLIRDNLPEIEIAIAQIKAPELAILSQQLHQYPVGASGAELAKKTHGAKYWIAPVCREVIVNLAGTHPQRGVCHATQWIDRADNSRTTVLVVALGVFCRTVPGDEHPAWVKLPA